MVLSLSISNLMTMCLSFLTSGFGEALQKVFADKIIETGISPEVAMVILVITCVGNVAGISMSVFPHLPGSVTSLACTAVATAINPTWFMIVTLLLMAVLLIVVQIVDYFMPALMAKVGGGGKLAVVLATVGLVFGAPIFGGLGTSVGTVIPGLGNAIGAVVGIFGGALLGAICGSFIGAFFDLKAWQSWSKVGSTVKVALVTSLSVVAGKVMKLLLCCMMLAVCIICCIIYYATA